MKITKVGGKGDVIELEIDDVSPAYINSYRRAIMEFVPTLAIELVEFRKNSSIMYDEMVAHRLGLLPLTTTKDYRLPSEEERQSQEYTAKSSVKATLTAKGPCTVYAKELKFKDPKVKPVHPETPILLLLEGQEIELEATAVLGQGRDHVKWSPGLAYYHELPEWKGKGLPAGDERTLIKKGAYKDIDPESKEFKKRTGRFYFKFESWGQWKPQEALVAGVEQFTEKLKEFDDALKAVK